MAFVRKAGRTLGRAKRRLERLARDKSRSQKKSSPKKKMTWTNLDPGQRKTAPAALGHPASKQAKKSSFRKGAVLGGTGVAGLAGAAAGIKALQEDSKDTTPTARAKIRKVKKIKSVKYKIKKGDTLSEIARDHNTTVASLMKANPSIKDKDMIYAGDTITIPKIPFPTKKPQTKQKSRGGQIKKKTNKTYAGGGQIISSIPSNRRSRG